MRRKYDAKLAGLAAALALGFMAQSAAAYILPAPVILGELHRQRASLKLRRVLAKGERLEAGSVAYPVWDGVLAGSARRLELKRPEGTEVLLTKGGKRWNFTLGSPAGEPSSDPGELILRLLTARRGSSERSLAWLQHLGVDTTVVSFGRQGGRVAFVIGAEPGQKDRPQLWIDKELLVPLRLVLRQDGHLTELRLSGYEDDPEKAYYPRRIERFVDGALAWRTDYSSIKKNPRLSKALFSTR